MPKSCLTRTNIWKCHPWQLSQGLNFPWNQVLHDWRLKTLKNWFHVKSEWLHKNSKNGLDELHAKYRKEAYLHFGFTDVEWFCNLFLPLVKKFLLERVNFTYFFTFSIISWWSNKHTTVRCNCWRDARIQGPKRAPLSHFKTKRQVRTLSRGKIVKKSLKYIISFLWKNLSINHQKVRNKII